MAEVRRTNRPAGRNARRVIVQGKSAEFRFDSGLKVRHSIFDRLVHANCPAEDYGAVERIAGERRLD